MARSDDPATARITAVVEGCTATLERRRAEARVIHLRNECPQAAADKAALLARMVEALLPDAAARSAIESLFLGRLVRSFPDLATRLARAASASADWDPARARRQPERANALVYRLATEVALYTEIEAALRPLGWRVRPGPVEKVLIAPARDTPIREALLAQGVAAGTLVPYDAMVWLRLASDR